MPQPTSHTCKDAITSHHPTANTAECSSTFTRSPAPIPNPNPSATGRLISQHTSINPHKHPCATLKDSDLCCREHRCRGCCCCGGIRRHGCDCCCRGGRICRCGGRVAVSLVQGFPCLLALLLLLFLLGLAAVRVLGGSVVRGLGAAALLFGAVSRSWCGRLSRVSTCCGGVHGGGRWRHLAAAAVVVVVKVLLAGHA